MLSKIPTDVKLPDIYASLASILNNGKETSQKLGEVIPGVYINEVFPFNYHSLLRGMGIEIEEYPDFEGFSCYGVCDDYTQILEQCGEIQGDTSRKFVVILDPVLRADQPPEGGWRWHKWGPYIGSQNPTCEYLYDEPNIEKVYTYSVYELIQKKEDE